MSSKTILDNEPSSTPTTLAVSRIVASKNASLDDTISTSNDVQQALSLAKSLPMDLSHLLCTNDSPSSQDAVFVSEWTHLLENSIVQLADASAVPSLIFSTAQCASIDRPNTQHADLQRLRGRIQSAVCQLPPEVWQEIFLFVRQSHTGMDVFNMQDPVYVVGRVCQNWRRASLRCPQLWSRFVVTTSGFPDLSHRVSVLRTVLERSCSVPIDFMFICDWDDEPEFSTELLSVLMQYSSRWRSVKFMDMSIADALLLGKVRGRIPQLQSVMLDLHSGSDESEPERRDMVSAFEIAPELSHVDLNGIPLGQVQLAKQNLQYLRVEHCTGSMYTFRTLTLSDILGAYPKLMHITLHCCSYRDVITWPAPLPSNTPRSAYANLTSLSVAEGDSITSLSLPNLTYLDAGRDGCRFIQGLIPCVISLLQHSRCRLSSLRLRFAEWDADSMGVLLSLVPDLETLSISSGGLPGIEDMMTVLTRFLGEKIYESDGLRPKYAHQLKTLCVRLPAKASLPRWTFVNGAFLDMVAMREECGALEAVSLRGDCKRGGVFPHFRSENDDDKKRWKDMCRRGTIDARVTLI